MQRRYGGRCSEYVNILQRRHTIYSSKRLRFPRYLDNRHMKVVMLSALRTGRLYPNTRYRDSLRARRSGDRIPVGARYFAPLQAGPGAHPTSCTMDTGSLSGVKRSGHGINHPLTSGAVVKGIARAIPLFPFWPSWSLLGRNLPFTFTFYLHGTYTFLVCTIYIYIYIYI
jgi:hypothetical protein